ncbi:MAG: Uma2 family endonuclease [Candidatus Methylumidiphilus sp.]
MRNPLAIDDAKRPHQKLPLYARFGVAHAWRVDPLAQTLEAFSLMDGKWLLVATVKDDDTVSVPPFEAISFSLAYLWV